MATAEPKPSGLAGESAAEELPRMSLIEHLEELRNRIVKSLIAVVVGFLVCWSFAAEIFEFLARPVKELLPEGTQLVYLSVTDPFVLYVKVAGLTSLFAVSPIVAYQFWRFVAPGLYNRERRYALPFVFFASLFFVGGGAFAYYVVFPFAAEFLLGLGEGLQAVLTVDRYFRFLLTIILGLGLMFELPIVILLLAQIGVVTPGFLMRHFRWAVLIIFVVAALITPTPDVVNLCLFAVPTIGLYLVGVGAAAIVTRGKRKAAAETSDLTAT